MNFSGITPAMPAAQTPASTMTAAGTPRTFDRRSPDHGLDRDRGGGI